MKKLDVLAAILLVVGGLNWGVIAVGGPDLVAALFGSGSALSRLVYGLVGLSAIWQALQWKAIQHRWSRTAVRGAMAMLALLAFSPLQAQMAAGAASKSNIVETAVAAGQFKTLAAALGAADLIPTLSGKGPFTVFAPTDAAFAKLPAGTVDALLKDKAKLTSILTYHVVSGLVTAADLKARADKDGYVSLTTVQGGTLRVHVAGNAVHVGEKFANVTAADVEASNGIIHVIDAVVIPQ
ncbi:MAG: fasciclin domain-containing protein [Gemmatimonadales bacterium]